MKRIDLGQVATILANLGVLIGILLLVYELAQNREMMQAQTRHSVAEMLINLVTLQVTDPEIAEIAVKVSSDQELTPVEAHRFRFLHESFWRYRENVHYQYRNGMYDEDEYRALRDVWLRDVESNELMRQIYCESTVVRSLPLAVEIDSLLERPCE